MGKIRTVMCKGVINIHPLNKDIPYYESLGFKVGVYRHPGETEARSKASKENSKNLWANYTQEQRDDVCEKLRKAALARTEDERKEIQKKCQKTFNSHSKQWYIEHANKLSESHKLCNKSDEDAERIRKNISEGTKLAMSLLTKDKKQEMHDNHALAIQNRSEEKENERKLKRTNTMRKNNSFNSSKPENKCAKLLINMFGKGDVKDHYKEDNRYPFECDFYIPSIDLFIEYNGWWHHGNFPYNPLDKQSIDMLRLLKEKELNDTTGHIKAYINTWTISDYNKMQLAKSQNLNFIVIYPHNSVEANIKINNNKYIDIVKMLCNVK